jgi:hypothetical protein
MTKPKNMAKCALCGDKIVSKHRYDWVECSCGEIFIDGGNDYWRAGARDFRNLLRYKKGKWVASEISSPIIDKKKSVVENIMNMITKFCKG